MALQRYENHAVLPPLTTDEIAAIAILQRGHFSLRMLIGLHGLSVTDDVSARAADLLVRTGVIQSTIADVAMPIPGLNDVADIGATHWYHLTDEGLARAKVGR